MSNTIPYSIIAARQTSVSSAHYNNIVKLLYSCGPGNVVGIATGYGLDGRGIESR